MEEKTLARINTRVTDEEGIEGNLRGGCVELLALYASITEALVNDLGESPVREAFNLGLSLALKKETQQEIKDGV